MSAPKKYHGVIVPMITPFTREGEIDESAAMRLTQHIVECGAAPFALGTTGESASLPDSMRLRFIEIVTKAAAGRCKIYAGISSNCLQTSVETARHYFDLGVDAMVAHLPSYYTLTAEEMLNYYVLLAKRIAGPLFIYNIKHTTNMTIPLQVIDQLSHHPNIVGVKDSERNLTRLEKSIAKWSDRSDFSHLVGWGAQFAHGLLRGSDGIVPSTGNVVPKLYQELYEAAVAGDFETAARLQVESDRIGKIYQQNQTLGQSIAALKVIMHELELCEPHVLPPLCGLTPEEEAHLRAQLKKWNWSGKSAR